MEEIEQTTCAPSTPPAPVAEAGPSKPSPPPLMQRVANWVFGYDYFISYAHSDGGMYAQALAEALRKRGRQCFLDRDQYRIGDDWKGVGHWTLQRTTCLIIVGSPAALTSEPVAHEVRLFQSMNNQIVPIDFDGSLTQEAPDSGLRALLPDTILRLREGERLTVGPSEEALSRIIGDFKGITQNRKRVRALTLAAVVFAVLAATAVYFGVRAGEAARTASKEAARNAYALSLSTSEFENDPWGALVFALRAAETLPDREPMLDLYLSRAMHLVDRLPDDVLSLPLNEGVRSAVFSPGLERVAVVTDNSQVHAFSLPDGRPLRVPDYVNERGAATMPIFFDKGRALRVYLNWFHPEPDPDEHYPYVLEAAWNLLDGTSLAPIDDGRISPDDLSWKVLRDTPSTDRGQAMSVKGLPPALRGQLTPVRGVGQAGNRVVTVSADGRVMNWSRRPPAPLVTMTTLEKSAGWGLAEFAGVRLVTLGDKGLQAWDASSGRRLWSLKAEAEAEVTGLLLSPDGSTIQFGDALIGAADGQKVGDLGAEDLEQHDLMEHAFVGNRKVVSALRFGWEAGDDLSMHVRDAARPGEDGTGQGNVRSVKPSDFMGFLQDGRYMMTGTDGSFRLTDWSSGKTVAAFRLGSSSRIPPGMAIALLKRVTRVEPAPARGLVRLTLRDGPTLLANGAEEITAALMLDGGTQSIAAPPRLETSLDATESLSADGRWLATAAKGRLRVWDASNGQPLTEWVSFAGDAKDLQFSADGSVLLLATSEGALIRLPVIFRWEAKPPWVVGLAEALTGLTLAQDGRVVPVPPQRLAELRAQVAAQLASDPADTPALRLLRSRLSAAHQPPGT